jgi:hypothetical protein
MTEFVEVRKRVKGSWKFGATKIRINENWQKISVETVDRLGLREKDDGNGKVLEFREYIEPGTRKVVDAQIETINKREALKEKSQDTLKKTLAKVKEDEDAEDEANKKIVAKAKKTNDAKKAKEALEKEEEENKLESEYKADMENSDQDEFGFIKGTFGWKEYTNGEKSRISRLRNKKARAENEKKKTPAKINKPTNGTLADKL